MLSRNVALIFFALTLLVSALPLCAKTVDVIAIEYPPFTSSEIEGNGVAFELLEKVLGEEGIVWRATYAPPARAASIIAKGDWCASFYPVAEEFDSVSVVLSKSEVTIGLVRKKRLTHEKANSPFKWKTLGSLAGSSVALLRTRQNSPFAQQFFDAGIEVLFVESKEIGIKYVEEGFVDYAISDNISFSQQNNSNLEFSQSSVLTTPVTLFMNPACDWGNLLNELNVN